MIDYTGKQTFYSFESDNQRYRVVFDHDETNAWEIQHLQNGEWIPVLFGAWVSASKHNAKMCLLSYLNSNLIQFAEAV